MDIRSNPRIIELRLAIILNYVGNMKDRIKVNNILSVLKAYVTTVDSEYDTLFKNVLGESINEKLLGANKKELSLTLQLDYSSSTKIAKLLGIGYNKYVDLYPDMKSYVTKEFIETLDARFAIFSNYFLMCKLAGDFYNNFNIENISTTNKLAELPRHVELQFIYIYKKLLGYFGSEEITNGFIIELCRSLKINIDIINELIAGRHLIYDKIENNVTTNPRLTKELVQFGYIQDWSKGKISVELLEKDGNYLGSNSLFKVNETSNDYFMYKWYVPRVLKDNKSVYEINKFLKVMGDFSER